MWRERDEGVPDIVTPTEREERERLVAWQRRRYFVVIVPCLLLVGFGFFAPAPRSLRLLALVIAAFLLPIAAFVGNTRRR